MIDKNRSATSTYETGASKNYLLLINKRVIARS